MDTIKHLFRIGYGPSSSHTMGPQRAAEIFYHKNPNANRYLVTLYGSLAATGKGHMTDKAINDVLGIDRTTIIWQPDVMLPYHPNGMEFESLDEAGNVTDDWTVYSVGGGRIDDKGDRIPPETISNIYPHRNMREIQAYLNETGMNFWEYVEECEGSEIWDYLRDIWHVMSEAVDRGVRAEGMIPGGLGITRKANLYFRRSQLTREGFIHSTPMSAYALAVSEENATGGKIVTAPTCGSCGVVPAVLRYFQLKMDISENNILRALATAGVVGNVAKHTGSISGA